MLLAIGVDPKIVRIVEELYNNTECAVVIDGRLTEWVLDKAVSYPNMFNIFLEVGIKELSELD